MSITYEEKLLHSWEEIFRQGLLTFWVCVALRESELAISNLRESVERLTSGTYQTSDQALYRLVRKLYDAEIVDMREVPGKAGPKKKLYQLSPIGQQLLTDFTQRNITLFMQPTVQEIIKKGAQL